MINLSKYLYTMALSDVCSVRVKVNQGQAEVRLTSGNKNDLLTSCRVHFVSNKCSSSMLDLNLEMLAKFAINPEMSTFYQ